MKNINEVAVLVQARLSSERCPRKMVRPFAGSTLTEITLRKLAQSDYIPTENIYLSAYEPELKEIGEKVGVNVFERSEHSAMWDGGPNAHLTGMYEWWDKIPFKYVVLVNACTPFLETSTIEGFIRAYCESDSRGMFAVMEKMNYFWDEGFNFLTPLRDDAMNTKNVQTTYEAAHCLYASRLDTIEQGIWMGDFNTPGDINLYPIEERECFDVDYEWEFETYSKLYEALYG
jgi:CMP-N-acetylneuraminic acid synthetase